MVSLRVVNHQEIEDVLDIKSVIDVVEQAYTLKVKGEASLFPMIYHEFEPGKADMDIKSGHLSGANIFGLKLVSWFLDNTTKNLPVLMGTVLVLDSRTGLPLGILSGGHITGMRTGAAGAIGAKYLARKNSESLLIVGTGHVAPFQVAATLTAMDNIKRVMVYNANSCERADAFSKNIKSKLEEDFLSKYLQHKDYYEALGKKFNVSFEAVDDIEKAAGEADIIITATPSRKPIINKEWVKPGTHISCIGADMEGKQEVDENLFSCARVYVDDITQALSVGEAEIPSKKGIITKDDMTEIGDVILGKAKGRTSEEDVTIFDSTGIALQDLLTASYVLKAAEEKGAGTVVEL